MAVIRVGPKHQITIPQEIFEKLRLKPGDLLEVTVRDDALYAVPQQLIPRDQAWFWTKEWQEMEREADEDIAAGRVSEPIETVEQLREYFRGLEA